MDKFETIIGFCKKLGLPITFKALGIDQTVDDGSVIGAANSKKLLEDIPNKVRDILGIIVDVNLLTQHGKTLLKYASIPAAIQ